MTILFRYKKNFFINKDDFYHKLEVNYFLETEFLRTAILLKELRLYVEASPEIYYALPWKNLFILAQKQVEKIKYNLLLLFTEKQNLERKRDLINRIEEEDFKKKIAELNLINKELVSTVKKIIKIELFLDKNSILDIVSILKSKNDMKKKKSLNSILNQKRKILMFNAYDGGKIWVGQNHKQNYSILNKRGRGYLFHSYSRGGGSILYAGKTLSIEVEKEAGLYALLFSRTWFTPGLPYLVQVFKKEEVVVDHKEKGSFSGIAIKTISLEDRKIYLNKLGTKYFLNKGAYCISRGKTHTREAFVASIPYLNEKQKINLIGILRPFFSIEK